MAYGMMSKNQTGTKDQDEAVEEAWERCKTSETGDDNFTGAKTKLLTKLFCF